MITVDLCSTVHQRKPTEEEAKELLRRAVDIARIKPDVDVRVPTGPGRDDRAVIEGHVLAGEGVEVF